ncbi:hypothetical protein [Nonomuraea salmonea]|uniref:Pentapeptide repeat-containing protein n=1 Tax=Nonomuraea salmonea TaxID=46181 RepID=A0ABV5NUY0_9ACTN
MNADFTVEPVQEGFLRTQIVRGEMRDQRFPLPAGPDNTVFDRMRLVDVDFSAMRFVCFLSRGSEFDGCDFSGTAFDQLLLGAPGDGAVRPQSVFRGCVFRRTQFPTLTAFGNVRFEGCTFERSRLRLQTNTHEAEFVDCVFAGPIRGVNFWGRPYDFDQAALGRDHNDFSGNDFTAARLDDVAFHHIDVRAQRFSGHALLDRFTERAKAVLPLIDRWPDAEHRDMARLTLEFLIADAPERIDDVALVSPADLGRKLPPALREELFAALRRTTSDTSRGRAAAPPGPDPAAR